MNYFQLKLNRNIHIQNQLLYSPRLKLFKVSKYKFQRVRGHEHLYQIFMKSIILFSNSERMISIPNGRNELGNH